MVASNTIYRIKEGHFKNVFIFFFQTLYKFLTLILILHYDKKINKILQKKEDLENCAFQPIMSILTIGMSFIKST